MRYTAGSHSWSSDPSMKPCLNVTKAIKDIRKAKKYLDSLDGAPDLVKEKARAEYSMPRVAEVPGITILGRALHGFASIAGPVGDVYGECANFAKITCQEDDTLKIELWGNVYVDQIGFNPKRYDKLVKMADKLGYEVIGGAGENIRLSPKGTDKKGTLSLGDDVLIVPMSLEPDTIMKIIEKVYTK